MKHKWLIVSILIVALVILCVTSLLAAWQGARMVQASGVRFALGATTASAKATEQKTLSVSGPAELNVSADFGNVTVKGGSPQGQISISAEKTAWGRNQAEAQAALKDIKVVIEQSGNQVKVGVQQPAEVDAFHIGPGRGSVNFTIMVPTETAVSLRSTNGDLSVNGTKGDASLHTNFGSIYAGNIDGRVEATSTNGDVRAEGIASAAEITLTSEFGSITLSGATGDAVTVSTTNGIIDMNTVRSTGPLDVTSRFGAITAGDSAGGSAAFRSDNGEIQLSKLAIRRTVTVRSDFGNISLTGVEAGGYDLSGQNGKISLDGAHGPIKVHSDLGPVEVVNARDAILDLSSTNGGVTFSGSLGDGPQVLSSDFGSISIILPADSALTVDLETDLGKITSDFPITVQGAPDSNHWVGTINGGGVKLTAKTTNGNITLKSSE